MAIVKAENAKKDIPLVSVIAVCYNHSKYLEETLDSILNQTHENIELVIIDSNSPDNSVEVIEGWIERNEVDCAFIKRTSPFNISQNLNFGIEVSIGEYIQVIATDDILVANKIEKQVAILESKVDFEATFTNSAIIDENSKITSSLYSNENFIYRASINCTFKNIIKDRCFLLLQSCLLKRNIFDKIGLFNEELLIEDWDFFLRYFKNGFLMDYSHGYLVYYRRLSSSLWTNKNYNLFESQIKLLNNNGLLNNKSTLLINLPGFIQLDKHEFNLAKSYLKDNNMVMAYRILVLYKLGFSKNTISKIIKLIDIFSL